MLIVIEERDSDQEAFTFSFSHSDIIRILIANVAMLPFK